MDLTVLGRFNIEPYETHPVQVDNYLAASQNNQDNDGSTLLHKYVTNCQHKPGLIEKLIKNGADLEIRNGTGKTAFLLAVVLRQKDMIEAFIKNGANVQEFDNKINTALHYLALPELNYDYEQYHNMRFRVQDTYEILERLLKEGVDVNAVNIFKETPLMWACRGSNYRIVKTLLKFGANTNLRDENDSTSLYFACLFDDKDPCNLARWQLAETRIMSKLILSKACVNCIDLLQATPLYYVVRSEALNKEVFIRDFVKAAALVNWKRKIVFHMTSISDLGELAGEEEVLMYVDICYMEIDWMKAYTLPGGYNLCELANGDLSEDELKKSPKIKDEVFRILLKKSFPFYNRYLLKRLGRLYLRGKVMNIDIFVRGVRGNISMSAGSIYRLSTFLDNQEILNLCCAFPEQFK